MPDQRRQSWTPKTFGALTNRPVNGGTPPTHINRYWNGNIPWITGADFTPSGLSEFRRHVSEDAVTQTALWAMNTPTFYRRVVSGLGATTSPHVNVGDIRRQPVCRPGRNEQDVIGHALTTMQASLRASTTEQRKLQSLKAGLMHDLLTDRVRMPIEGPREVAI